MMGFKIGIGVGLKYSAPIGKVIGITPSPEKDIKDAFLMDDGTLFIMEDDNYFKLENENKNVYLWK